MPGSRKLGRPTDHRKSMLRGMVTFLLENGKIEDGSFVGDGCAISQASADIMLDMIIGRSVDEAKDLAETFLKMIKGEATDADIEKLEEAGALQDISHMPARVKCAVLGWHTMEKLLDHKDEQ